MKNNNKNAVPANTIQLFTIPETPDSAMGSLDLALSSNFAQFMQSNLQKSAKPLADIERDFTESHVPELSRTTTEHVKNLMTDLVAHASHTADPCFIGHMTSALPQFLLPLSKLMTALNQNVVKLETSDAFTPMERQVLAMMHHLAYSQNDAFYENWIHNGHGSLGVFCSGGTVANITALWNARNLCFKPDGNFKGIAQQGMFAALKHSGHDGVAVLVSERGHYSVAKSMDSLGLGRESLICIPVDGDNRIRIDLLEAKCAELSNRNIKIMAMIGIAGSTETGSVDPLDAMATVAQSYGAYFHVDAAWGGATLMSARGKKLMQGIERADSITIDAHKQMYVPMGAGMVLFKDPQTVNSTEHHASYILRRGSKDLGRHTLEGSRPGMAMLVHACLHIIGRKGYEALIDASLDKAKYFASIIQQDKDFELVSAPELCLLTYRYVPDEIQQVMRTANTETVTRINDALDNLTVEMQATQRDAGNSFVSRTQLKTERYGDQSVIVFRVVLANPLTTNEILHDVLQEQKVIAQSLRDKLGDVLNAAAVREGQRAVG